MCLHAACRVPTSELHHIKQGKGSELQLQRADGGTVTSVCLHAACRVLISELHHIKQGKGSKFSCSGLTEV